MNNEATQPIDDGGPAFPSHGSMGEVVKEGMSLRDWFAGMVMGPLTVSDARVEFSRDDDAEMAYDIADAMIAARKARP